MTNGGGRWTRCAEQHTTTFSVLDWQDEGTLDNWYACHLLEDSPSEIYVVATNGTATHTVFFQNVNLVQGASEVSDTTGFLRLNLLKDTSYGAGESCSVTTPPVDVPNNYHLYLVSEMSLFGYTPQGGAPCPGGPDLIYLYGHASTHNGCTTAAGVVPNLGYPCETIEDVGAHFSVFARRP